MAPCRFDRNKLTYTPPCGAPCNSQPGLSERFGAGLAPHLLATMKKAKLPSGAHFRLTGSRLTYQSGQLDGHPFNGQLCNTGYFLVEELTRED